MKTKIKFPVCEVSVDPLSNIIAMDYPFPNIPCLFDTSLGPAARQKLKLASAKLQPILDWNSSLILEITIRLLG